MMKLYSGPLSMFGRKAEIACQEKGVEFELELVPFSLATYYEPKHEVVRRVNPKEQVPVLVDGDLELYDSTQIFEYLEDIQPEPALWPKEPRARARARQTELASDEVFFPEVTLLMPHLSQGENRAEEAKRNIAAFFRAREEQLKGRDYLCVSYSYADIAFFMAQLFAAFLGERWSEGHPNLDAWKARLMERPPLRDAANGVASYLEENGLAFSP